MSVQDLNAKGFAQEQLGKYKEAIAFYDRALEQDPEFISALQNKGYSLLKLKEYEKALVCFNKILAIDPGHIDALGHKGLVLEKLDRHKEAITCYHHLYSIGSDDIGVGLSSMMRTNDWIKKANFLEKKGDYHTATSYYDLVLLVNPNHIHAKVIKGTKAHEWYHRGEDLESNGNFAAALSCYEITLIYSPSHKQAYERRSRLSSHGKQPHTYDTMSNPCGLCRKKIYPLSNPLVHCKHCQQEYHYQCLKSQVSNNSMCRTCAGSVEISLYTDAWNNFQQFLPRYQTWYHNYRPSELLDAVLDELGIKLDADQTKTILKGLTRLVRPVEIWENLDRFCLSRGIAPVAHYELFCSIRAGMISLGGIAKCYNDGSTFQFKEMNQLRKQGILLCPNCNHYNFVKKE